MALRGRLPLDHDGLVGAATGNDILWGCRGRLLGQGHPARDEVEVSTQGHQPAQDPPSQAAAHLSVSLLNCPLPTSFTAQRRNW